MIINYEIETHLGIFSDRLELPEDYAGNEEDIEQLKLAQLDLWIRAQPGVQPDST